MSKELQRLSTVVFVDTDEMTANQIQGAIEAFAKANYGNLITKIERHSRPVFIDKYVEKVRP